MGKRQARNPNRKHRDSSDKENLKLEKACSARKLLRWLE